MAGLLDLTGGAPTVTVNGTDVVVPGVSVSGLAALMQRYPVVRDMLTGGDFNLNADTLFELGPDVVASLIAAGTGNVSKDGPLYVVNPDAEAIAAALPLEVQFEFAELIIHQTFPGGPQRFFARLTAMAEKADLLAGPVSNGESTKAASKPRKSKR